MYRVTKSKPQHGFTMIEILVALVILSVGVLGLAGLQGASLKSSNTAYMRTVATSQIYDFAERMRSNSKGFNALIDGGDNEYNQLSGIPPSFSNCNIQTKTPGAGCNPQQLAIRDVAVWNTENARVLPKGQGTVRRAGQSFIITVSWDEENLAVITNDGFGFPVCDPLDVNALKCVQYRIEP